MSCTCVDTCMRVMLPAGVSPGAQSPSGSLKAAWTKTKVTGHEVARLLCVSTNVPLRLCLCVFILQSWLLHAVSCTHVVTAHENETICFLTVNMRTRPLWEHTLLREAALGKSLLKHCLPPCCQNTQSHRAIGCFLMTNLFLKKNVMSYVFLSLTLCRQWAC